MTVSSPLDLQRAVRVTMSHVTSDIYFLFFCEKSDICCRELVPCKIMQFDTSVGDESALTDSISDGHRYTRDAR